MAVMLICKHESTSAKDFSDGINVALDILLYSFEDALNTEGSDGREVSTTAVHARNWVAPPRVSYDRARVGGGICRVFSDNHWLRGRGYRAMSTDRRGWPRSEEIGPGEAELI